MTARPIIFSAPMIAALLDGRKAQTRRLAWGRFHPAIDDEGGYPPPWRWGFWPDVPREPFPGEAGPVFGLYGHRRPTVWQRVQPGDLLWAREAWALADNSDTEWPVFRADGDSLPDLHPARAPATWRSPIHMPRWASRLTLEVTDVRVQRLQEISEADAVAEGIQPTGAGRYWIPAFNDGFVPRGNARQAFRDLWDRLHGPDAWDANPWVCALTFTVHRCNIDAMPARAA